MSGMNTSRNRKPVAKNSTRAMSVVSSYGLGSMKTTAPEAPTSQTSARCRASTPGAAVAPAKVPSAVAAYAITNSRKLNTDIVPAAGCHCEERSDEAIHLRAGVSLDCFASLAMTSVQHLKVSVSVLVLGHQGNRRPQENEEVEQHRPVLDVIEVELDALLDLLFVVDLAAPAVDLRPAGDAGLDAVAGEIAVDRFVIEMVLGLGMHGMRARADQRQVAGE